MKTKLRINRDTLRRLENPELRRAEGAGIYTAQQSCFCSYKATVCPTLVACPA
jgi:hypothetical protein